MMKKIKGNRWVIFLYRLVMTITWAPVFAYYRVRQKLLNDVIFCENFLKIGFIRMRRNNWGDDINKFFFEYLTGKKTVFIPYQRMSLKHRIKRYQCIGSTLGFYEMDNTVVYGTGVIDPRMKIRLISTNGGVEPTILSVRGPKSRKWLLDAGIQCPEMYGDPALLLSLFYKPNIKAPVNEVLLIPHKATVKSETVTKVAELYGGVKTLDMEHYDLWTDIVDEIAASKFVISESLHGLIVAETYGIPNIWVEFKEHWEYWEYKFEDYYESIGKYGMKSLKLYEYNNLKEIIEIEKSKWKEGNIPYTELLESFPFEIVVDQVKAV